MSSFRFLANASFSRAALAAVLAATVVGAAGAARANERPSGLERLLPADVIGFVKLERPGETLRAFLDSDFRKRVEATSIYQFLKEQDEPRKFFRRLDEARDALGRDVAGVIDDLVGEGAIAGVRLSFPPAGLLVARSRSPEALAAGIESLKNLARTVNNGVLPETTKSEREGVAIETVDGKVSWAVKKNLFFLSNSLRSIEDMLDLAAGKSSSSVAGADAFAGVLASTLPTDLAVAAFRPAFVPEFRVPEKADEAIPSLIGSGWLEVIRVSDLVSLRVFRERGAVGVRFESRSSKDPGKDAASIFFPAGKSGAALADMDGLVGLIHLNRDIAKWWQRREEFLDARTAGQFLEANNVLSVFFGGMSFQDEVLPQLEGGVTLVGRPLSFEGLAARPTPELPGFAAIFHFKDIERLGARVSSAFFQLITIINFERGKNNQSVPFVFDSETVGDVRISVADLNMPKDAEHATIEYNFSPSVAVVGPHVIIGSNKELTRDLVKRLSGGAPVAGGDGAVDLIKVSARDLGALLAANRDFLANTMVLKEGISAEEAKGRLHAIGEIIGLFEGLTVKTGYRDRVASLEVRLGLAGKGAAVGAATRDF